MSVARDEPWFRRGGLSAWVGLSLFIIPLLFVPPVVSALNYFDPVKRWAWCVFLLIAAFVVLRDPPAMRGAVAVLWSMLVAWIVARSLVRPDVWIGLETLVGWLMPVMAFAVGGQLARRGATGVFAGALVLAGVVQAGLMMLQLGGFDPLFAAVTAEMVYQPGRMIGTIGYHNQAADFLALCLPAIFLIRLAAWARWALSAALLAVIAMTASRGAMAGSVVAFTALLLSRKGIRSGGWAAGLAMVIFVGTIVMANPTTRGRLHEIVVRGAEAPAIASRLWLQKVAWSMWSERPWTGWGAGAYALQYTERLGDVLPEEKNHAILRSLVHAREPHHDLLQFGAEFGVVGVAMVLGLLALIVSRCGKNKPENPELTAAGIYVIAYMAISSSVSFPWQAAMAGPLAGLWLGFCSTSKTDATKPGAPRVLAPMLLFIMSLWASWEVWLNVRIPKLIERENPEVAAAESPRWGHKYTALAGAALAADKKYDEARVLLEKAYKGFRDVLVLNNLGHVYAARNDTEKARSVYEIWVRSGIEHKKALDNASVINERCGDFARAADLLARRMELWPEKDAAALGRLATLYHRAGEYEKVLWAVYRLRPRMDVYVEELYPETMNLAGATLIQLGRPDEAVVWLEQALAKNPQLLSAQKNLENLRGARGVGPE